MALHKKTTKPFVHLQNSDKQHLVLAKFYSNNASFIFSQSVKFQMNKSAGGLCEIIPERKLSVQY